MLRISLEQDQGNLSLVVEGRLVGPWVDELRRVSAKHISRSGMLLLDLCGVTAMDARGQTLLNELRQGGATLRCSDVMNLYLVEQMARPAGYAREMCRPCRRISSQSDLSGTAKDVATSYRAS